MIMSLSNMSYTNQNTERNTDTMHVQCIAITASGSQCSKPMCVNSKIRNATSMRFCSQHSKCCARTSNGRPCKNTAENEYGVCWIHRKFPSKDGTVRERKTLFTENSTNRIRMASCICKFMRYAHFIGCLKKTCERARQWSLERRNHAARYIQYIFRVRLSQNIPKCFEGHTDGRLKHYTCGLCLKTKYARPSHMFQNAYTYSCGHQCCIGCAHTVKGNCPVCGTFPNRYLKMCELQYSMDGVKPRESNFAYRILSTLVHGTRNPHISKYHGKYMLEYSVIHGKPLYTAIEKERNYRANWNADCQIAIVFACATNEVWELREIFRNTNMADLFHKLYKKLWLTYREEKYYCRLKKNSNNTISCQFVNNLVDNVRLIKTDEHEREFNQLCGNRISLS